MGPAVLEVDVFGGGRKVQMESKIHFAWANGSVALTTCTTILARKCEPTAIATAFVDVG